MSTANSAELYIFEGVKNPRGNLDTINFDGATETDMLKNQFNYYSNHPTIIYHSKDFTPIHEDSQLQIKGLRTTFENANYLMYKFNNKWYYAFINGVVQQNYDTPTNDGTLLIQYELDLMQTYLWKIKTIKNTFTVRRHLPNNQTSVSPRIYDELTPLYKNIVENKKYNLINNEYAIKWLVFVSKSPKISPSLNGDINPFTYLVLPVKVSNTGIAVIPLPFSVGGTSSPDPLMSLSDMVKDLTGNRETDNIMTSQVVNFYLQDDIPINYTVDSATGKITITDTGKATYRTDPTDCIEVGSVWTLDKTVTTDNIVNKLWEHLKTRGATEYQLINSNLCGASIANSYGSMDLEQKQLINMSEFKIAKRTNLTPQGDSITTLNKYMGNNLIAYQMGIRSAGKQQTVISNSTATYMQANKNAYAYKKESLDLQQQQLNATQHLQSSNLEKTTQFANRQYDINYGTAGNIAFYGQQAGNVINGVGGGIMTGLAGGGVLSALGGIAGAVTSGAQVYNNIENRGLQKDKDRYNTEYQQQSVNLAQQQQQQNMDMSRKAFASENADRALQPLTINQMGLSTSLDYMNDLYTDNIVYWVSDDYTIKMANNELMRDGTFVADYYDFSDMMSTRPYFNKIMIADRIEISLNQSYKEILEMTLTRGVRFWNYSARANLNDFEKNYMVNYNCG